MSTSKQRETPVHYMGDGPNVLWELEPGKPSDAAYHRGADISMLSQFAAENEVLFPPGTMLVAKRVDDDGESQEPAKPSTGSPSNWNKLLHMPTLLRRSSQSRELSKELTGDLQVSVEETETGKRYTAIRVMPYFI